MSYSAFENTPIIVDLLIAANDTGWSLNGDGTASHVSCNSGYITLLNYPAVAGHTYTITYTVNSISGGYVQAFAGGAGGTQITTPEIVVETITAGADGTIQLFSNAVCQVQLFNIVDVTVDGDPVTIVYATKNRKWSDNRTTNPAMGLSLYERTLQIAQNGAIYVQQVGSESRNNFFGVQYDSTIKLVDAEKGALLKTYNSIALQAAQLMVTTDGGITTSLGQVSSLIEQDFLKSALNDGVSSINVYDQVGVYGASFLRDQNQDIINGDALAGNYIIVELITTKSAMPLRLFTVAINDSQKKIGNR